RRQGRARRNPPQNVVITKLCHSEQAQNFVIPNEVRNPLFAAITIAPSYLELPARPWKRALQRRVSDREKRGFSPRPPPPKDTPPKDPQNPLPPLPPPPQPP